MINDYEKTTNAGDTSFSAANNESAISTLNGLIETCKDGQEGFRQAADGVDRSDLKSLFYEFSQQRAQFAGELQTLVQSLGGDPEDSGSMAGTMHRGWINIKSAVTGRDEAAILAECERGEDSAKNMYKEALNETLPAHVKEAIQNQYTSVQSAHDRVKALRDAHGSDMSNTASTGF